GSRVAKPTTLPDRFRYPQPILRLDREIRPYRDVVGRLLPATHMLVDADRAEPVGRLRGEHEVIDADAVVLLPGTGLVIPESIEPGIVARGADRIREPEMHERSELGAGLRQEERIADPQFGIVDVDLGGNDVEIARKHQRLFEQQPLARIFNNSLHPFEFIYGIFRKRRVALWEVKEM